MKTLQAIRKPLLKKEMHWFGYLGFPLSLISKFNRWVCVSEVLLSKCTSYINNSNTNNFFCFYFCYSFLFYLFLVLIFFKWFLEICFILETENVSVSKLPVINVSYSWFFSFASDSLKNFTELTFTVFWFCIKQLNKAEVQEVENIIIKKRISICPLQMQYFLHPYIHIFWLDLLDIVMTVW